MKQFTFLLLFTFGAGMAGQARAESFNIRFSESGGRKQIRFISQAPIEAIEGVANRFSGYVSFDTAQAGLGLKSTINVPANALDTGMALRNSHLYGRDWLNAQQYPNIQFTLASTPQKVTKKGQDTWVVNAVGTFTMKGRSKKITVPVTMQRLSDNKLSVKSRFSIKLSDFGIHGPSAMNYIGVKVANDVNLEINLVGTTTNRTSTAHR
jgi:polyisoprenoid-binding protein YceI